MEISKENSRIHLLFEQSGTFKTVFSDLGYEAYDYDIKNDFLQTDYLVDLFLEIEKGYRGEQSIFDKFKKDDLLIAFFPCVRFTRRMIFNFVRSAAGHKKFDDITKLEQNIKYFDEMNYYYSLISKLVIICLKRDLRLVVENPYHQDHILSQFWHIKPKIIDMDRRRRGDDFKKPTQYFFINCEPENRFVTEAYSVGGGKTIEHTHNKVERSLINKRYVERFLKEFILGE